MWLSFTSDEGDVTTRWRLDGSDWRLAQVILPIEHVLEGFTEAWNRSDLDGVVAFCPEGSRMADALRRLIERRGWTGRFPPLEGYDGEVRDYGRASVTHLSAEGEPLRTRWHFTDGRWLLAALDPPE
jgi:hypothetical protein